MYYSNPDRLRQLQKDILTILDTQHVVYPLVSPFEYIVYDPGISGVQTPAFLPSTAYVPHVFAHSSLNQGFEAIPTGKGVRGFFRWIFNPTHK